MAVASANAANAAAKAIVPPASSFAELLRRSRFASYDPAIAQTYTAPPAYARRGNYGLKRSVPMPYKDSYISVNTFEHHAHFAEWNNAEVPVKFLKRVEEQNITPRYAQGREDALGDAKVQWLIDSEFAESDYSGELPAPKPIDAQGQRGPGGYGTKRPPPQTLQGHVGGGTKSQVNIQSLTPHEFQRYLAKLRELTPEYKEYLLEQHKARHVANAVNEGVDEAEAEVSFTEDEHLLYVASKTMPQKLHRTFLGNHFSSNPSSIPSSSSSSDLSSEASFTELYPDLPPPPTPKEHIERQPHRVGGLAYHHMSHLETIFTTQPQPGIILQHDIRNLRDSKRSTWGSRSRFVDHVALYAGLVSRIAAQHSANHQPFYHPSLPDPVAMIPSEQPTGRGYGNGIDDIFNNGGVSNSANDVSSSTSNGGGPTLAKDFLDKSITKLRLLTLSVTKSPTTVVGYTAHKTRPTELLKNMEVKSTAGVDFGLAHRHFRNPFRPGSMQYCDHPEYNTKGNRFQKGSGSGYGGSKNALGMNLMGMNNVNKTFNIRNGRNLDQSIYGVGSGKKKQEYGGLFAEDGEDGVDDVDDLDAVVPQSSRRTANAWSNRSGSGQEGEQENAVKRSQETRRALQGMMGRFGGGEQV